MHQPDGILAEGSRFVFSFLQFQDGLSEENKIGLWFSKIATPTGFRRARPFNISTSSVIVALIRKD